MTAHRYQFRSRPAEHLYLGLSKYGGKVGPHVAAALTPLVALNDRRVRSARGSVVPVHARRRN